VSSVLEFFFMDENLHHSDFDYEPTKENLPEELDNDSSPHDQFLAPLEAREASSLLCCNHQVLGRLDTLKFYDHIKKQNVLVMVDPSSTLSILYKKHVKRLGLHLDTFEMLCHQHPKP
jgi:hypothetical protein